MRRSVILGLLLGLLIPSVAGAQSGDQRTRSVRVPASGVGRAMPGDVRTFHVRDGRVDVAERVRRAWYGIDTERQLDSSGQSVEGRRFMQSAASEFGWEPNLEDLELIDRQVYARSSHFTYRQMVQGVPVLRGTVKVSLDVLGRTTMAFSQYSPRVARAASVMKTEPTVSVAEAQATAAAALTDGTFSVAEPELYVLPADRPLLVWRVLVFPENPVGEWEVLVDARDGELVSLRDRSIYRRTPESGLVGSSSPPIQTVRGSASEGAGLVFDPDPLTSAGEPYAPPFVDSGDFDEPLLNAERVSVTLSEISAGSDGLHRLEGPYVAIVGGGPLSYSPPAEANAAGFNYVRSDDRFEAVNAYYHIDASQRYVQSLGYTDVGDRVLSVNPQGLIEDNSLYTPTTNFLQFGVGGVDDAEDAGVIRHEYGHSLLEDIVPGLIDAEEGQALHEGWADYWAASYLRGLAEAGKSSRMDWENIFRWDSGDGQLWPGRAIGKTGRYPEDTRCDDVGDLNHDGCDIYQDGLIWASTLMEVYDELGREVTDRLSLQSHRYLVSPATFRDAAEAMLQADEDLFGGSHGSVLLNRLGQRGYLDPSLFAPVVEHDPLKATEDLGGNAVVLASVSSATSVIDSVAVVFRVDDGADQRLLLTNLGGGEFSGQIPLPLVAGTVSYFVEAFDQESRRTVVPIAAPVARYSFAVGPDTEAPVILHDRLESVSTVSWPPQVAAEVDDNAGVDSVWVPFTLRDPDSSVRSTGTFGLTLDPLTRLYEGAFPISISDVSQGSLISYRIVAQDIAQAANSASEPVSGDYDVAVSLSGELVSLDFESVADNLLATGVWERGEPVDVLQFAHSGDRVWATGLSASYPALTQISSLELPSLNLGGLSDVFLTFWHWHDFEHRGPLQPGVNNPVATIWDGGNVKVSVDGGDWLVLVPDGGYTGTVDGSGANPLSGEEAFGGYSFGWRREVIRLPIASDVRVRWDLGTDGSNTDESLGFAGWFVDDITVTTLPPTDDQFPSLTAQPDTRTVLSVESALPPISVRASDDIGIEAVELIIDVSNTTVSVRDTRLAMSLTEPEAFATTLQIVEPVAGDEIAYRIRVADFGGNEITLPPLNEDPFTILFRVVEESEVLTDATGAGIWHEDGGGWIAEGPGPGNGRSGLLLEPIVLPSNAEQLKVRVQHTYSMGSGVGGNVKMSLDDGHSWTQMTSSSGYPATFVSDGHPLDGEDVFQGSQVASSVAEFDLGLYAGLDVRLLFDLGHDRELEPGEFWAIERVQLQATGESELEVPLETTLHSNFPDPFATTTTVTYTLSEEMVVQISVYDIMGRRVQVPEFVRKPAGTYSLVIDGSGLASGMYFIRMIAGDKQMIERIVIAR